MRVRVGLTLAVLVGAAPDVAPAQFSFDARRVGMAGVSLTRDGNIRRYNPAYRAIKGRSGGTAGPKFAIPLPLGLIDFLREHPLDQLGDDPMFDPDSAAFNPVELLNLILNPPIFYEIREAPTPTNDVEFTIGENAFVVDLGGARVLIPEQEFGLGSTSRLLDMGMGFGGFNVGVMGFMQYEVGFTLDDALRRVLKQADSVQANTSYGILGDGVVQTGFAPTISFAGRLTRGVGGDAAGPDDGIYLGAALHYYLGATYGRATGSAGFTTGDPVFGATPLGLLDDTLYTSNKPFGHGVGGDVGIAFISGPFEVGFGINDIGAELTWSDTKVQRVFYDPATDSITTTVIANHVETKTELPVTYIANAALHMGTGTTIGGEIVNSGRGTAIHLGVEQRTGAFAVRGGIIRDQRKRVQFAWGGGVRLGPVGLDVGFWTHSNSFATQRGITMATSLAIY
ncbi:MAG: hypothetical protein ACREMN_03235 [Gemmatimonadales bacterium]